MRLSASFFALIATVVAPTSALYLYNGVSVVDVSVESSSTPTKRDGYNCKGSSLCSNSQGFVNECNAAFNLIDNSTTYYVGHGSTLSGTCVGNCGVFVQPVTGDTCTQISGQSLINGYINVREVAKCPACGSDQTGDCSITINYVSKCSP